MKKIVLILIFFLVLLTFVSAVTDYYLGCRSDSECDPDEICAGYGDGAGNITGKCVPDPGYVECDDDWDCDLINSYNYGWLCKAGICAPLERFKGEGVEIEKCNDGKDNDNDGDADCADTDCYDSVFCYEMLCDDELDNDFDGYTDCDDSDCSIDPECRQMMTFEISKESITADDSDFIEIEVSVNDADGNPVAGENIIVWIETSDWGWQDFIGFPKPQEGTTDADGKFTSQYSADEIYEEWADGKDFKKIPATIYAKHLKSETTLSQDIEITAPTRAKIMVVEAVQSIRSEKAMLVSGKKTVVFVGIRAKDVSFFEENDSFEAYLDLEMIGSEFSPTNSFQRIPIEASQFNRIENYGGDIERRTNVDEHLDFFYFNPDDSERNKWVFYEFYVDGLDTKYNGKYDFKAKLYIEQDADLFGKETVVLSERGAIYDVFSSGFVSVKLVPIGLGLWHDDLCEYCVTSKDTSGFAEKVNQILSYIPKRIAAELGNASAKNALYEFDNCNPASFRPLGGGANFTGILDLQKLQSIINKDNSPVREVCKDGINNLFSESDWQNLASQSPIVGFDEKTGLERYLEKANDSKSFFKAVMPLAEENIYFQTSTEPFSAYINPKTNSPLMIMAALHDVEVGRRWSRSLYSPDFLFEKITGLDSADINPYKIKGFDRVIGFVPTNRSQVSDFTYFGDKDTFGYSSGVNRYAALVDLDAAGKETMVHELLHTYCAKDEYGGLGTAGYGEVVNAIVCSEGFEAINSNKGETIAGTEVTNGFWVEKRKFMGTPSSPLYSIMGESDQMGNMWITDDLYTGVGVKLRTFPYPTKSIFEYIGDYTTLTYPGKQYITGETSE
ncbi:MAG: hypothetical protein V1672_04175 [Candidatus Diapherotrites archaeon]